LRHIIFFLLLFSLAFSQNHPKKWIVDTNSVRLHVQPQLAGMKSSLSPPANLNANLAWAGKKKKKNRTPPRSRQRLREDKKKMIVVRYSPSRRRRQFLFAHNKKSTRCFPQINEKSQFEEAEQQGASP
jgi:hypothetical protein